MNSLHASTLRFLFLRHQIFKVFLSATLFPSASEQFWFLEDNILGMSFISSLLALRFIRIILDFSSISKEDDNSIYAVEDLSHFMCLLIDFTILFGLNSHFKCLNLWPWLRFQSRSVLNLWRQTWLKRKQTWVASMSWAQPILKGVFSRFRKSVLIPGAKEVLSQLMT